MSPKDRMDGGSEAQRGFLFQTYAILLYLLIRRIESRDLKVASLTVDIEPLDGEDAKFISASFENDASRHVAEIVQCKKRESKKSVKLHAGIRPGDEYLTGDIDHGEFRQWIEKKRGGQSVVELLAASPDTFYTAIIFGEPKARVRAYVPQQFDAVSDLKWYSPMQSKFFSIDYQHPQDPAGLLGAQSPKETFASPDIRRRIRVLVVDSPSELEAQCALFLRQYEGVGDKAFDAVRELRTEIENRATLKGAAKRGLSPGDVETIIAPYRVGQGAWRESDRFLSRHEQVADPNRGEPPRWADFEQGRYGHRDEFDSAWDALMRSGFVVVCGPAGTGKTTFCHYLAYKYLKEGLGERAYYLPVRPGLSGQDAKQFFEAQIYSKTLFVIDDEHFAPESVEEIVRVFVELRLEHKPLARLVVASTTTYGRTRALKPNPLNQADSIRLLPVDREAMRSMLDALRNSAGLASPLSNDELSFLSKGYIGLALILARCAQDLKRHHSWHKLFTSRVLKQTLEGWVLELMEHPGDHELFRKEVAPVFYIASSGLPIPRDFRPCVETLGKIGLLEVGEEESEGGAKFYPTSIKFAIIISQQSDEWEKEQGTGFLAEYLEFYPEQLPAMFERLADSRNGFNMLRALCKSHFKKLTKLLSDPVEPLDLAEVTKILRFVYKAARGDGHRLLEGLALPASGADVRFFSNYINLNRAKSGAELNSFLSTIYWMDGPFMRQLALTQLEHSHARSIRTLFELDACGLDTVAACLRTLSKFNRPFTETLYERLKSSGVLGEKAAATDDDARRLSIWIRFCDELRYFNRDDAYAYLEQHVTVAELLDSILRHPESNSMHLLLLRMRRLNPRLAAEVASRLWLENRNFLNRLIEHQADLNAITNDLYVLSLLNRRIAIGVALKSKGHICDLVSKQDRYSKVSSAVESLHKNVGLQVASSAALAIDRERMLPLVRQEDRKIDVVGKFLYCVAQACPEVAAWFEERLDYSDYLDRINSLRLRNLAFLTRGFLTAAHPSRKVPLLQRLLMDKVIINEFNLGWVEASNLTEVAFALSFLLDTPISRPDILKLLGIDLATFERHMRRGIARESSVLHIANGLYAAAKFDIEIGRQALEDYVGRVTGRDSAERTPEGDGASPKMSAGKGQAPKSYEPQNLTDLGRLLQIAAAIRPSQAQQLAALINIDAFADYAREEINLGRLVPFILGLNDASRKIARDFISRISTREIWERQYLENPEMENVSHFARALAQVSRTQADAYIRFVFEYPKNNLVNYLEIEANLLLVSNWLRLLRISGPEFARPHVSRLIEFQSSAVGFDTRLFHLIEATGALIEAGDYEMALDFAETALGQKSQLNSVRRLHQWLTLFHKSLRIGRELNLPDFSSRLFSDYKDWHFGMLLAFENQPVVIAYAYHLFKSTSAPELGRFREAVSSLRATILDRVRNERRLSSRILALILAEASLDEVRAALQDGDRCQPWELALASLLFEAVYPNETNPVQEPFTPLPGREALFRGLNEHTSNLEFGLTLHLAAKSGFSQELPQQFLASRQARSDDELLGVTRWLLQQEPGTATLSQHPHYLWRLLEKTVLKPLYLSWEDDISAEADRSAFKDRF